jgi:hypothetical protein|tara:strand:- start:363 stop:497 length:135 start_codon:yes stop_codon:yes gene_type:complete
MVSRTRNGTLKVLLRGPDIYQGIGRLESFRNLNTGELTLQEVLQ